MTLDSDGTKVALAWKGWPLEVWDIEGREMSISIPMRNPLLARFNPASDDVFGADEDGTVMRFEPESGSKKEIDAQSHVMTCNPNGTLLATGNGEGCLKIFTADTLELLYKMDKYDESITDLTFSPDGHRLYDIRHSDCNIWVPEVLLVNARDYESSSEESETFRQPVSSSLLESANSLQNITALVCSTSGDYVCCGKSNGRVAIYDTKTGKQLHVLYKHAPTVNIEALVWSSDGQMLASGDNSGRVMVVSIHAGSPNTWSCAVQLDFHLDLRIDGGVRQLVLNDAGDRLLVSSQRAATMFLLKDGSTIGARHVRAKAEWPCWLTHPHLEAREAHSSCIPVRETIQLGRLLGINPAKGAFPPA